MELTKEDQAWRRRQGEGIQRHREDRSRVGHRGVGDAGTRAGFTGVGPFSHTGSRRLLLWLNFLLSCLKILNFNQTLFTLLWASQFMQLIPTRNCIIGKVGVGSGRSMKNLSKTGIDEDSEC